MAHTTKAIYRILFDLAVFVLLFFSLVLALSVVPRSPYTKLPFRNQAQKAWIGFRASIPLNATYMVTAAAAAAAATITTTTTTPLPTARATTTDKKKQIKQINVYSLGMSNK